MKYDDIAEIEEMKDGGTLIGKTFYVDRIIKMKTNTALEDCYFEIKEDLKMWIEVNEDCALLHSYVEYLGERKEGVLGDIRTGNKIVPIFPHPKKDISWWGH